MCVNEMCLWYIFTRVYMCTCVGQRGMTNILLCQSLPSPLRQEAWSEADSQQASSLSHPIVSVSCSAAGTGVLDPRLAFYMGAGIRTRSPMLAYQTHVTAEPCLHVIVCVVESRQLCRGLLGSHSVSGAA